ncbi:MAG: class I SAM-dependent methyltransferase [Anaerolineales bacterium]
MLEIRHASLEPSATRRSYNRLYGDRGILLRDSFYIWLIGLLNPQLGKSLLDVSCGQGRLVFLAQQRGLIAHGVDFAIEALRKSSTRTSQQVLAVADGERLPYPKDSVDYVTHIGSLEHYEDPLQGACEIRRVLRPGGRSCILLPNAYGLLGNIKNVWITGDIHDDGQPLQRYATRQSWIRLLSDAGLHVERVVGYGEVEFPRTIRDASWLLRHPQKILRWLVSSVVPINLTNHFVFIVSPIR